MARAHRVDIRRQRNRTSHGERLMPDTMRPTHPALVSQDFEPMTDADAASFDPFIEAALAEDIGVQDVTSMATVDAGAIATAAAVARQTGVAAGIPLAARVFKHVDPTVDVDILVADGSTVTAGVRLLAVTGPARSILAAERVALNILCRLSGIATLTRQFVDCVRRPYAARIADTRKTTPGLRRLERYAVRAGGGANHRFNLSKSILIKDNHLALAGTLADAVRRARAFGGGRFEVEVECESLDQVRAAIEAGADAVLLDNMTDEQIREAVSVTGGRVAVEASGGMSLDRIAAVDEAGVDVISVGALT